MEQKVFIGRSLLQQLLRGEKIDDYSVVDIPEGIFILTKTEGCVQCGTVRR